jgi:hypothetical protein
MQLRGKHSPTTIEGLRFLCGPCRGLILKTTGTDQFNFGSVQFSIPHVEAGSNTYTVTLRVLGGDKKGSLKSVTVKYDREYEGTRTRERLRWQGQQHIQR